MGEEIAVTFRACQVMRNQSLAIVVRVAQQMLQGLQCEVLTDHGSSLQGLLVFSSQPVHARQHETLNSVWNLLTCAFLDVAHELFQEQRVALRPREASFNKGTVQANDALGDLFGLGIPQGAEINRCQRTAAQRRAPALVKRVTLHAGGHHQDRWARGDCRRNTCQMRQGQTVGPMHVLHDDHDRLSIPGLDYELGDGLLFPDVAGYVVHGVVDGAQVCGLRQVQQVVQKGSLVRVYHSILDR